METIDLERPDAVICSTFLPDGNGLDVLAAIHRARPELPVFLLGRPGATALARTSIRAGARDFLTQSARDLPALRIAVDRCVVEERLRKLDAIAHTDDLTGLCNRRRLGTTLRRAWDHAQRHGRPLAFMMMDLDGFKAVNDQMGHQCGDRLLVRTARIIQANCRDVDVPGRFGGDEFCVLMPECSAEDAMRVARRILREYERADRERRDGCPASGMSVGVAHIERSGPSTAEQLMGYADEALYAAKSAGKRQALFRNADGTCTVHPHPLCLGASVP
ncbi:MAG: GGDEF domain-containing protein [Planctomycetota bacterium]